MCVNLIKWFDIAYKKTTFTKQSWSSSQPILPINLFTLILTSIIFIQIISWNAFRTYIRRTNWAICYTTIYFFIFSNIINFWTSIEIFIFHIKPHYFIALKYFCNKVFYHQFLEIILEFPHIFFNNYYSHTNNNSVYIECTNYQHCILSNGYPHKLLVLVLP